MPKDEFDFEDPFELNGVALRTHEDTTDAMAECFIEEFLRLGYTAPQVLALFRNSHYVGPHLALAKRGEPFVRALITDVCARWGRPVPSPAAWGRPPEAAPANSASSDLAQKPPGVTPAATVEMNEALTDPLGAPIPNLYC